MAMNSRSRVLRGMASLALLLLGSVLTAPPALAATTSIDYVETEGDTVRVVLSLSDVNDVSAADLGTATVLFDPAEDADTGDDPGEQALEARAEPFVDATNAVQRTAVLAMDVSDSMAGAKFAEAKLAANAFLDNVPADVAVGLVTFAADVAVVQEPTTDIEAVRTAVADLRLTRQTRLYDGLIEAVRASGDEGSRSILLLSDGRDTSSTRLEAATGAVEDAEVKVNVVALAQSSEDEALLQQLADAGNGMVLRADDPAALSAVFAAEAEALASQVLLTVTAPPDIAGREGTLSVTLQVDGAPATDQAFVSLPGKTTSSPGADTDIRAVDPGFAVPTSLMYAGLGAAALGVMLVIIVAVGWSGNERQDAVDRSIEAYTRKGAKRLAEVHRAPDTSQGSMTQQAVAVAQNVLQGQKGLEAGLGSRLEAGGLAVKPAEWLLIHMGVAVAFGLLALLLGSGNILFMLLGLFLGLVGPWFYLSFRRSRRLRAFKAQLADTLQLMAGALSAGLSLAQSVDTVVREGSDPMASEFRRAIVEQRLGVEIEDALMGIADRMHSVDFEWVVMAIRIQREVGGNLAELLNKVADTIREREYLERQVKTLSAEGRLSVWILGGLPPGFLAYLAVANPSYLRPMFTNPLGWAMLVVMTVLLLVGIFWMKKVVKVEV